MEAVASGGGEHTVNTGGVGISAGANVVAALQAAQRPENSDATILTYAFPSVFISVYPWVKWIVPAHGFLVASRLALGRKARRALPNKDVHEMCNLTDRSDVWRSTLALKERTL